MILGTEKITKDITVIFEGAPRDKIFSSPNNPHLSESETDVHIEALIKWNEDIDIPILEIDTRAEKNQMERLIEIKNNRDSTLVSNLLNSISASCKNGDNLVPPITMD